MEGEVEDYTVIPGTPGYTSVERPIPKTTLYTRRKHVRRHKSTISPADTGPVFRFTPLEVRCSLEIPNKQVDVTHSLLNGAKLAKIPVLEQFGVQEDGRRVVCSIHSYFPYVNVEVESSVQFPLVEIVISAWFAKLSSEWNGDVYASLSKAGKLIDSITYDKIEDIVSKQVLVDALLANNTRNQQPAWQYSREKLISIVKDVLSNNTPESISFLLQYDNSTQCFVLFCLFQLTLRAMKHAIQTCTAVYAQSLGEALNLALQIHLGDATLQSVVSVHTYTAKSTFGYRKHCSPFIRLSLVNPGHLKTTAKILLSGSCLNRAIQPFSIHIENYMQSLQDLGISLCTKVTAKQIVMTEKNKFTTHHVHAHAYHVITDLHPWKHPLCDIITLRPHLSTLEKLTSKLIVASLPCHFPFKNIVNTPKLVRIVTEKLQAANPWKALLPNIHLKPIRRMLKYVESITSQSAELPETPRKHDMRLTGISLGGHYDSAQKAKVKSMESQLTLHNVSTSSVPDFVKDSGDANLTNAFTRAVQWVQGRCQLTRQESIISAYTAVHATKSKASSHNVALNMVLVNRNDSLASSISGSAIQDSRGNPGPPLKRKKTDAPSSLESDQCFPRYSVGRVHAKRTSRRGVAFYCDLMLNNSVKKQKWLPERLVPENQLLQFESNAQSSSSIDVSDGEQEQDTGNSIEENLSTKPAAVDDDMQAIQDYQQAYEGSDELNTEQYSTPKIGPPLNNLISTSSLNSLIHVYPYSPSHRLANPFLDPILYIIVYLSACNGSFEETFRSSFILFNSDIQSNTPHIENVTPISCAGEMELFSSLTRIIHTNDPDELIGFSAKSSFWFLQQRHIWQCPGDIPIQCQWSRLSAGRQYHKNALLPVPHKQNVRYLLPIEECSHTRVLVDGTGAGHVLPVTSEPQQFVHSITIVGTYSAIASTPNELELDDVYGRTIKFSQDCYDDELGQGETGSLREQSQKYQKARLPMITPSSPQLVCAEAYCAFLLFQNSEIQPRTNQMASMYGIRPTDVQVRGSQLKVEGMFERFVRTNGLVSPSMSGTQIKEQPGLEAQALNRDPEAYSAYYDPVAVFDFRALYPSVIIAYNMCYSTCLGKLDALNTGKAYLENDLTAQLNGVLWGYNSDILGPLPVQRQLQECKLGGLPYTQDWTQITSLVKANKVVISTNGCMFVHESVFRGVFPRMVAELQYTRLHIKRAMKSSSCEVISKRLSLMQHALKVAAAVSYGYLSASFTGRMPCAEIADSVVQTGRDIVEQTCSLVDNDERASADVCTVYGDTDSLFVRFKDNALSLDLVFCEAQHIQSRITEKLKFPVHLVLEKVYCGLLIQTKKRYVGNKLSSPELPGDQEAKGLEVMRKDQCPQTSDVLRRVLGTLFETRDVLRAVRVLRSEMGKILSFKRPISDFLFARNIRFGKYSAGKTPPPAAALIARQCSQDLAALPFYKDRIQYQFVRPVQRVEHSSILSHVVTRKALQRTESRSKKHSEPLSCRVVSLQEYQQTHSDVQIDGQYYAFQQVLPAAMRLLCLISKDAVSRSPGGFIGNFVFLNALKWGSKWASSTLAVQRQVSTRVHRSTAEIYADKNILTSCSLTEMPVQSHSIVSLRDQQTEVVLDGGAMLGASYVDRRNGIPALTPLQPASKSNISNTVNTLQAQLTQAVHTLLQRQHQQAAPTFYAVCEYTARFHSQCIACFKPLQPQTTQLERTQFSLFTYQSSTHARLKYKTHFCASWCILYVYASLYTPNWRIPEPMSMCRNCVHTIQSFNNSTLSPYLSLSETMTTFSSLLNDSLRNISKTTLLSLQQCYSTCSSCTYNISQDIEDLSTKSMSYCENLECAIFHRKSNLHDILTSSSALAPNDENYINIQ